MSVLKLVRSAKPCPSDWADSLIPTTLEMGDDAVGITNKGSIVERQAAHRTPPGEREERKTVNDVSVHVGSKEITS